jgi:hypothetical protein
VRISCGTAYGSFEMRENAQFVTARQKRCKEVRVMQRRHS